MEIIVVVVVIIVCLASSPIVLSLATGVCEPDVVTYTTLAQELKKNLIGMCDTRRANEHPSLWVMVAQVWDCYWPVQPANREG